MAVVYALNGHVNTVIVFPVQQGCGEGRPFKAADRRSDMDQIQTATLAYVIEDEVNLAAIFSKALGLAGFQTRTYHNGQEAINSLDFTDQTPALVLLDLNLPLVSGKEILRFIRSDQRFTKTRVILATSDSAAVAGEVELKSDIVLLKPISFTQLRDLASRFL
jgi:DNA-binding response OmpR family regulator